MNHKMSRAVIKTIEKMVDFIAVLLILAFILYGGYSMWDTDKMYNLESSTAYAAYHSTREELGFEQLKEINPNVFGWLTVYGTNIDYPLLQSDDNQRYTHTNARGEPAMSGAIFLDFRNSQDLTDFNNIIYGHDMAVNAMFGEISHFEQRSFFESHRYGMIFNGEEYYGLEIFAFLLVDAHDFEIYNPTMADPAEKEAFLQRISTEAIQYHELDITTEDHFVMLSTCTPTATNGRHILMARLMDMDEVPEDIFGDDGGDGTGRVTDRLFGLGVSPLGLATGSLLVIVVTVSTTLSIAKKKKKKPALLSIEDELEAELIKDNEKMQSKKKKKKKPSSLIEQFLFLFGKIAMVLIMIALLFTFVFGATQVNDATMAPAMQEGDIAFFQRIGQDFIETDTVVLRYGGETQVRRVVAVEGDTVDITDEGLIINDLLQQEFHIFEETTQFVEGITFPLVVPAGEVFVLGDSRGRARDSRIYGTVRTEDILGNVVTIIKRRNL